MLNQMWEGHQYNNISTNTTTTVKTGAGTLHAITVNTTAAGTITVYDNTAGSGTKIATLPSNAVVGTYLYDIKFQTGLTIVTAAGSNITVSFH